MENTNSQAPQGQNSGENKQTIIIQQPASKSNGIGTAGFVLALAALVLVWAPILNSILWLLGLILSGVGVTKQPRGLAIAGLCISLIGLVVLLTIFGLFAASAAAVGH
ncbi:hypothetical protein [Capnocytophaga gingivalis]|jgi:hypothetical protein|uniref:DUF4190 domain-containing protein n=1 Tax=Capnocytophaga gingivalis TaxID=1017 RepID=A0A250FSJ8_9FLAO|nr:hypothetical protein [Capnocytophaga gingivalis]ATA86927.1 hypothetical protein CGC50_07055 [Capnocytophaga gingivalis]EEK15114.1 hypothetical protein CAPGI0001_0445 [Capnocytophaga gingivalis ATCC 33624]MEB3014355.1 hypothetical protein [Capnocytophaga gingivalis]